MFVILCRRANHNKVCVRRRPHGGKTGKEESGERLREKDRERGREGGRGRGREREKERRGREDLKGERGGRRRVEEHSADSPLDWSQHGATNVAYCTSK